MSTTALLIAIAILAIAAVGIFLYFNHRSRRLRSKFGPEYSRAVEETGSKYRAESRLEKLERRVEKFSIRPLGLQEANRFRDSWRAIQAGFVDNPKVALTNADRLLSEVMLARGYPVADFEDRAAEISSESRSGGRSLPCRTRNRHSPRSGPRDHRGFAPGHDSLPHALRRPARRAGNGSGQERGCRRPLKNRMGKSWTMPQSATVSNTSLKGKRRGYFASSPGGGALGLAPPLPPRVGGCHPSLDGPFWKKYPSLLYGPVAYMALACPKIFPARSVSS